MNGATAVPLVKKISPPKSKIVIKRGNNHNFLLAFKNANISAKNDMAYFLF